MEGTAMKTNDTNDTQDQKAQQAYEPPRLEVMSLQGDEVLETNCKTANRDGLEDQACLLAEGGLCEVEGS